MAGRCKGMVKEIYILKRNSQDRDAWKIVVKCALDTKG